MSDLGGGRASNGGARTGGPVPVSTGTPSGMRTPRDIMRDRAARDARRLEEQKSEEQRRLAEDRRQSAERRAATVATGGAAAPRFGQASSQNTTNTAAQQGQFDGAAPERKASQRGNVAGSDALGDPVGRTTQEYPAARPRAPSSSQPVAGGAKRTQQSQSAPRQPAQASGSASNAPAQSSQQGATTSSFPHAFERWETLSSHWEGLTSYWLHKLEQNTEEIRVTIPNASTLNRQITDLSAAGANLFHAVVELQRLRASSERKFQRWFFETRADTERNQELQAQLEKQLKLEGRAREEATQKRVEAEDAAAASKREVAEMRRELMISKEEARRAWEELGRRNQESLETAQSLKEGRLTVVSGVQVVPYFGGPSRTGSSQRPATRDGQQYYGSAVAASSAGASGLQPPGDDGAYYRNDPSPTNTDPFTDSGRQQQATLHHEPGKSSVASGSYQPYALGSTPTTSGASAQTVIPPGHRAQQASSSTIGPSRTPGAATVGAASSPESQRFYQHDPVESSLHAPVTTSEAGHGAEAHAVASSQAEEVHSEVSFGETLSEGETEYAIDASGNIRHDEQGRPIVFRRRIPANDADEHDETVDLGEPEPMAQYHPQHMPEAPSVPATSAQAMASYAPTTSGPTASDVADYEGEGYGGGWEALQTRHHHPTRLSDVLEEEEERSSRRTAE